jgi:hypothetical protein
VKAKTVIAIVEASNARGFIFASSFTGITACHFGCKPLHKCTVQNLTQLTGSSR